MMHIVCYVRDGARVFETYWTTTRGVEAMDYSYALDGPHPLRAPGGVGGLASRLASAVFHHPVRRRAAQWPPVSEWPGGRPIPQWSRLGAGRSADLGTDGGEVRPPPGPGRRPPADESRSPAPSTG